VIGFCDTCRAEYGPWERRPCPLLRAERGWRLTVPDLAVAVLEQSDRPLTVYDIARSARRDFATDANESTLQVSISTDPRFCWAGKGLYGLYRHGLVPGPRSLAGVARIYLYSHGPLSHAALDFVMKHVGYRFQSASLNTALNNDGDVYWFNWEGGWYWDTARTPDAGEAIQRLGVGPTQDDFERVVARCAGVVRAGLAEFTRRVAGS
jgi:hypothetical protein